MKYDVFISYSRKDSAVVKEIVRHITDAGYSVWMDIDGIESGDEFKEKIVAAIEDSEIFLFFSSSDSNVSPWTVKEVNVAVALKKSIIPIKLDESAYNKSIMFDLAGLDFVKCHKTKSSMSDSVVKLLHALEKKTGKSYRTAGNTGGSATVNNNDKKPGVFYKYVALILASLLLVVICVFVFGGSKYSVDNVKEQYGAVGVAEPVVLQDNEASRIVQEVVTQNVSAALELDRPKTVVPVKVVASEKVAETQFPPLVQSYEAPCENKACDNMSADEVGVKDVVRVVGDDTPAKTVVGNSIKTEDKISIMDGHEFVDLGLPSGLKWATCNVGAALPSDYGGYFAWGEVYTKGDYTPQNCSTYGEDLDDIAGDSSYDVASALWGSNWRMPTKADFQELIDCCTWVWTKQKGKYGYKITGKNGGKSIFLPACGHVAGNSSYNTGISGYYWSSTPEKNNNGNAYLLRFYSGDRCTEFNFRITGYAVRPVCVAD